MADVFISYSRKDAAFVSELEHALVERGKAVWVDKRGIGPGTKWREEIGIGLTGSDSVVFVVTPDSLASPECSKELDLAVSMGKRIVPVVRRDTDGTPVPEALGEVNYVWLRDEDEFGEGIEELVAALDTDIGWVHLHTKLETRAKEWDANRRKRAYLLRGTDLTEAERTLTAAAGKKPEPTALQLEYVAASRTGAKRFMQKLVTGVAAALVVAIVLSIVAFIERSNAVSAGKRAFSRQLAADAETQLGIDPELSVLLASKAYDVSPTAESVDVLRQAVATSKLRMAVRPADGVSQAQLTPDGRTLVTVGRRDGVVRLWAFPGGRAIGVLPGVNAAGAQVSVNPADGRVLVADARSLRAVVFRARGQQLAVGSRVTAAAWGVRGRYLITGEADGTVEIWNGTTGARIGRDRQAREPIVRVAMSSTGKYLAAVTQRGATLLYDLRHRRFGTLNYPGEDSSTKAVFSPDETRVLTYNTVLAKLWSTSRDAEVGDLSTWAAGVRDAAFAPGGSELVLGAEVAAIVDPTTGLGGTTHQYLGHDGFVNAVAFGPDSTAVATGGQDGTIKVWDPSQSGSTTTATLQANAASVDSVSWSQDGREIVSVDGDGGTARVWANPQAAPFATVGNPVITYSAALSPDGRLVLTADDSGRFALFDTQSNRKLRYLPGAVESVNSPLATLTVGFADGGRLAYEVAPGVLKVWHTRDGAPVSVPTVPGYTPRAVIPSNQGARALVSLSGSGGMALDSINLSSGAVTRLATGPPAAIAISSDGLRAAIAYGRSIRIQRLDHPGARVIRAIGGAHSVRAVSFSADGRRLAVGGPDFLDVFNVSDGKLVGHPLALPRAQLESVALSGNGSIVAAGFDDVRARVWGVAKGDQLMTARPTYSHATSNVIGTVRLSPDGQFLLTGPLNEGSVEVWAITTGGLLGSFNGDFAGWSSNSRFALTTSGPAQLWSCDVCIPAPALRALARTRVTRSFTPGEAANFLTQ